MADTAATTNGFNPEHSRAVLESILDSKAEIRRLKKKAANSIASDVASLRQDIGAKIKEAKVAWGIPSAALKAEVKLKDLDRQKSEVVEQLDEDDRDAHENYQKALGDFASTPLAMAMAPRKPGDEDFEQDVRGADQREKEAFRKERKAAEKSDLDALGNGAEKLANLKTLQ